MKITNDEVENYRVFLDGELVSDKMIIFSADTSEGKITYILNKEHFPYWPSQTYGEVRLERING